MSQVQSLVVAADTRGKHRIVAELKRLEQETSFLEEELEKLGKAENASACCKELLTNVETRPDPLLPVTSGPQNPVWDIWFGGPQNKKRCGCWERITLLFLCLLVCSVQASKNRDKRSFSVGPAIMGYALDSYFLPYRI